MKKFFKSISRFFSRANGRVLAWIDSLMKCSIGWQLFWVLVITLGFFGLCSWLSGVSIYELFLYATNPPEKATDTVALTASQKWLVAGVFIGFSIIFLGLFVTLFVNWIDRRRESFINGDSRYNVNTHFALIMGGHSMVSSLCQTLLSRPANHKVVILSRRVAESLRKEIFSVIDPADRSRVLIYNGSRISESDIDELNPECANSIYIIGENTDIDGDNHDETNMDCYNKICANIERNALSPRKIPVHVMFCYQSTFSSFQFTDIPAPPMVRFIPFNFFETWAQQVVAPKPDSPYRPLEGSLHLNGAAPERVHLIIVGMSKMGVAMAVQAAQVAHYPNFVMTGRRTLITVIDCNMHREMDYFRSRYPVMFALARQRFVKVEESSDPFKVESVYTPDFTGRADSWYDPMSDPDSTSPFHASELGDQVVDIDWEFIEGDVASPAVRRYLEDAAADPLSVTNVAVCLPDTVEAVSAAIFMPDRMYDSVNQVLVYQEATDCIIATMSRAAGNTAARGRDRIRAFGMMNSCHYISPVYNLEAKLIHYFYDGIRYDLPDDEKVAEMNRLRITPEFLDDLETRWNLISGQKGKSAISQKWSNIFNANMIPVKLRSCDIDPATREISRHHLLQIAATEHLRWNVEQILAGFRPELPSDEGRYTSLTDKRNHMIHPSITSFDLLSPEEQEKDTALTRCIPTIIRLTQEAENYYRSFPDKTV